MPYIPPADRPALDAAVDALAETIAEDMQNGNETSRISTRLRAAFLRIAGAIREAEAGKAPVPDGDAAELARRILEAAAGADVEAGWVGALNYALTRLIQAVPDRMVERGAWDQRLRYWIYAQTAGALNRTAWDLHRECGDGPVGNGLCGVFIDVKDEYKRRVNTAYEAAQILKNGDCYDRAPFRTRLVHVDVGGVAGCQEVMLVDKG